MKLVNVSGHDHGPSDHGDGGDLDQALRRDDQRGGSIPGGDADDHAPGLRHAEHLRRGRREDKPDFTETYSSSVWGRD